MRLTAVVINLLCFAWAEVAFAQLASEASRKEEAFQAIVRTIGWTKTLKSYDCEYGVRESSASKNVGVDTEIRSITREQYNHVSDTFNIGTAKGLFYLNKDIADLRDEMEMEMVAGTKNEARISHLDSKFVSRALGCPQGHRDCLELGRPYEFDILPVSWLNPTEVKEQTVFEEFIEWLVGNKPREERSVTKLPDGKEVTVIRVLRESKDPDGRALRFGYAITTPNDGFDKGLVTEFKFYRLKKDSISFADDGAIDCAINTVTTKWRQVTVGNQAFVVPELIESRAPSAKTAYIRQVTFKWFTFDPSEVKVLDEEKFAVELRKLRDRVNVMLKR